MPLGRTTDQSTLVTASSTAWKRLVFVATMDIQVLLLVLAVSRVNAQLVASQWTALMIVYNETGAEERERKKAYLGNRLQRNSLPTVWLKQCLRWLCRRVCER